MSVYHVNLATVHLMLAVIHVHHAFQEHSIQIQLHQAVILVMLAITVLCLVAVTCSLVWLVPLQPLLAVHHVNPANLAHTVEKPPQVVTP